MSHRESLLNIRDFLKPYQKIWQNEILHNYPNPLKGYPEKWVNEIFNIQDKSDLLRLEKKETPKAIKDQDLLDFYKHVKTLSYLPQASFSSTVPEDQSTWNFMSQKKRHEIKRLAPFLNDIHHNMKLSGMVDIGGGVGLLAQTMANTYRLNVLSLDMNSQFQNTGILRQNKNKNKNKNQNMVEYRNLRIDKSSEFIDLLKEKVLCVGLHTCGKLAIDMIQSCSFKNIPALINFGCCYHTLDESQKLQNISQFAQKNNPLWFSKYALTLACRGHRKISEKDFILKPKVKSYRYAIHILLHQKYNIQNFISLGSSNPKLYELPFEDYVLRQFEKMKLTLKESRNELREFYECHELQTCIKKMLSAELLRNAFGRLLELYLLYDRAIYLEECGYKVEVNEFFDEDISPRNIGIVATLPV